MSTYIGKVQIGNEEASVGSTLYGLCSTTASDTTKIVVLNDFDAVLHGVTIFVKFNNGNTAASGVRLQIGNGTYNVVGNCICQSGEVLSFTFDETDNGVLTNDSTKWRWIVSGHAIEPATATPQAIGTAAVGTSVKYAKEDHVHSISLAEGDANGQVKIAGQNVSVHGLGDAAYTDADAYATAAQGTLAEGAMPKSGGEFSGNITFGSGTTLTIPTIGNDSDNNAAATKKYVDDKVAGVLAGADAMIFKGTIGAAADNPTIQSLPNGTSGQTYMAGDTYRVITAGTYAGEVCEVGDLIIAIASSTEGQSAINNSHWTIAQTNIDGAVIGPASSTAQHVAVFNDTTGKEIEDSGFTLGKSVPSGAVFTDTTYTITNGTAYTAHTLSGDNDASILASVSQGVLTLAPGIKFTTGTVSASLNPTTSGSNS